MSAGSEHLDLQYRYEQLAAAVAAVHLTDETVKRARQREFNDERVWLENTIAELKTRLHRCEAEAAERMRIVEDLAASDPYDRHSFGRRICRHCGSYSDEQHANGCLWMRARKAVD